MAIGGGIAGAVAAASSHKHANASINQPPYIIRFESKNDALVVLKEAVSKVFPNYSVENFDYHLIYLDEHKKRRESESVKGRQVANVFIVSIDYGNFYEGVDYEVWLIADYVREILASQDKR